MQRWYHRDVKQRYGTIFPLQRAGEGASVEREGPGSKGREEEGKGRKGSTSEEGERCPGKGEGYAFILISKKEEEEWKGKREKKCGGKVFHDNPAAETKGTRMKE
ncbi:hypothetical protein E2C01_084713 [Portunus trituberculatus]|uniref:Uncharacterized protein n=1 Tax=Portunus trituberculatus TaxID=210409 RepID=A0A5B7JBM8_PORTR|nr:hypothetical protein [Portunus trituberculatus]